MKEKFKFINLFCCLIFLICILSCGSDYSKYSSDEEYVTDTEEASSEEGTGDVTDSADTVYLAEVSNIVWSATTNVEGGCTLVSIKWTAPADEDLQGFLVTYSKTDSVDTPVSFTVEGKNKTEISMEADAAYTVTVKSVDTSGKQSSGLTEIINISSRYSLICTVTLDSFEANAKIPVIKVVREITGLGLGEAKALVEKAPATIKEGVTSTEADEIIKELTDAGGKASKKVTGMTKISGSSEQIEETEETEEIEETEISEQTEYAVTLESFEASAKIPVIKIVREITGLGLGEAKALVEKAPATVKEGVTSTEADEIIKKLTDAGGKASKKVMKK